MAGYDLTGGGWFYPTADNRSDGAGWTHCNDL